MPAMSVLTKADVKKVVMEELNVSKATYGTFDGSPLYKGATAEHIDDVIVMADDLVVSAIIATPGHPRRIHYTTLVTFSTPGVRIPLSGSNDQRGVMSVEITRNDDVVVQGKLAPAQKISEWILGLTKFGGNDVVDGYYDITDGNLIFSGKSISVQVLSTTAQSGSATNLSSPPEYKGTVCRVAMRELLQKDPAMQALAQDYAADINRDMQLILAGIEFTPPFKGEDQVR